MKADIGELKQEYQYGFHDPEQSIYRTGRGLSREVVAAISEQKREPEWMRAFRLDALERFQRAPMPRGFWGNGISDYPLNFDDLCYYFKPSEGQGRTWDEVPTDIKNTFERLGIPEAERKYLGGVGAQYDSEVVYHSLKEDWTRQGVIFLDTDTALREHGDLVREYFGTIVPPGDNKFAALNSAVWSGGSFIYVPAGVKMEIPLQAYFRINAQKMGQFERTLIIAEEGSFVHYIEGCTAPTYSSDSLHAAVVEIVVKRGARVRYSTIQNWSTNVYNLVTKRAVAYQDATMEWVDGNLGSKVTMKYPAVILREPGARAELLSIAFAGKGQFQDAGGRVIHAAPHTTSSIISKSISKDGGRSSFRGQVKVRENAVGARATMRCDALLLDPASRSDTYPRVEVAEKQASVGHEAVVSRVGEEQLFYLMSRGLTEQEATALIVNGFIEPIVKQLPMEYAVEMNRLIELQMEGSLG